MVGSPEGPKIATLEIKVPAVDPPIWLNKQLLTALPGELVWEINPIGPTLRESHVLDRLIDIRSRGGAVAVKLNPNLTEGDGTVLNSNIPKFISAYPDNGVCRIGRANDEEAIEVDRHVMLLDRDDVASQRAGNDILG